jgi:hypothetical protein
MRLDRGHGSPYDRGSADSYYQRSFRPHYFVGDTYNSDEIQQSEMTFEECEEYIRGWRENQAAGNFKDWG